MVDAKNKKFYKVINEHCSFSINRNYCDFMFDINVFLYYIINHI